MCVHIYMHTTHLARERNHRRRISLGVLELYIHRFIYMYLYLCMGVHIYIYMKACVYTHITHLARESNHRRWVSLRIYIYTYVQICIYFHLYLCVCIYLVVYIYMHVCVYTHTTHLARERNHRRWVSLGVLERSDDVGQARAWGGEHDARPSRRASVPLRRVAAALLRPVHHEPTWAIRAAKKKVLNLDYCWPILWFSVRESWGIQALYQWRSPNKARIHWTQRVAMNTESGIADIGSRTYQCAEVLLFVHSRKPFFLYVLAS